MIGGAAIEGVFGAISGALATVLGLNSVMSLIDATLTLVNEVITTGISNDWQFTTSDWIGILYSTGISFAISRIMD